ncbi:amyloid-beta-like protein [Diaphorina citri]|uniref:Amyloid-beta-like protein n=1 Tax=Diaphorina citri TaxID=121845 RepID=A0A1S4ELW2_DIACI|nr:amyloid-beta-like protein [Diaphorina citri]
MHREKVTKVMKDWSDLEERYQDMRSKSPGVAEDFKQKMTLRFQQTVQSLEEEGNAEKHQLIVMHQQRVAARINQHKKDAMNCYIEALNDVSLNTHKVQKCLQKLLRALHKDRHHTIAHYKHLLATNLDFAVKEKPMTLEHLVDIDHTINQSMTMLQRHPALAVKISELMQDYMQALRSKDETPGSLLSLTREAEEAILDKYKAQVIAMQEDKERERFLEKQRKEVHKHEREELREEKARVKAAAEGRTYEPTGPSTPIPPGVDAHPPYSSQRHDTVQPAYAMSHDLSIGEPSYLRHEVRPRGDSKGVYVTVVFAGLAVMAAVFIAMTVLKRRSARSPQNLGFIEVDQAATPEERHVANMQINGYENPTYKYFEIKE